MSSVQYSYQANRIPGAIGADDGYWQWLEKGEFRLPSCQGCRRITWPAHFRCAVCGSWEFDWVPVALQGTVYAWTRAWYAFDRTQERAEDLPYVVILAEIDDANGARLMGVLKGSEANLKVGARVSGSIDPPSPKSKGYAAIRWTLEGK